MSLEVELELVRDRSFRLQLATTITDSGITAIHGPSGAGKSSLLRCLSGLEPTATGVIRFRGRLWQAPGVFLPCHRREIGQVFHDARLFPHLDIDGNLAYSYRRRFSDCGPTPEEAAASMGLEPWLHRYPAQLSAGQQQRAAIARTLVNAPQLLMLDEPLAALDAAAKPPLLEALRDFNRRWEVPVLYVSHQLGEILQLADQMMVLKAGQLLASGTAQEISTRLDLPPSHEENAMACLHCVLDHHEHQWGLSVLRCGPALLQVDRLARQPGERLRIEVAARDVSISREPAQHSSILNRVPVTLEQMVASSPSRTLLRLRLGEQHLLARLTRKSVAQLELEVGMPLYAQIKSVALPPQLIMADDEATRPEETMARPVQPGN